MSVMLEKNDKINVVVPSSSLWMREDVSRVEELIRFL